MLMWKASDASCILLQSNFDNELSQLPLFLAILLGLEGISFLVAAELWT